MSDQATGLAMLRAAIAELEKAARAQEARARRFRLLVTVGLITLAAGLVVVGVAVILGGGG